MKPFSAVRRVPATLHLFDLAAASLWNRCHCVTESLGALNLIGATGRASAWQQRAREAIERTRRSALTYALRDEAQRETPAVVGALPPWTYAPLIRINTTLGDITCKSSPEDVRAAFEACGKRA